MERDNITPVEIPDGTYGAQFYGSDGKYALFAKVVDANGKSVDGSVQVEGPFPETCLPVADTNHVFHRESPFPPCAFTVLNSILVSGALFRERMSVYLGNGAFRQEQDRFKPNFQQT